MMPFHSKGSEFLGLRELRRKPELNHSIIRIQFLAHALLRSAALMNCALEEDTRRLDIYGLTKSNTLNQNMVVLRPKKRKGSTFLQSPWHKVYREGSELCHNISTLEQKWGLATNTLCEKFDPTEAISPSKRRLVLSTHLIQQLLQPAPAFVFSGNNAAAFNYEIILYFVSRITLANSCSLKCHSDLDKSTYRQTLKTANDQDQQYFSLVYAFMEKIQNLENDFQSLERTTSILDIILEIQDLERFSVINHLGKFHNRAKTITRPIPQRYVVGGIQMPMNLPKLLHCLPL